MGESGKCVNKRRKIGKVRKKDGMVAEKKEKKDICV